MGHHHHKIKRRTFLGQASCAAVGLTTLFSTVLNLKAMNAAANLNYAGISSPFDDYKAIVCFLMAGGCDTFNMLVPTGTSDYQEYSDTRSNQAIPVNDLNPINPTNTPGKTFGLHPSLSHMATNFDQGKVAFISNIGTLIEPVTQNSYWNGTAQIPLGLYSHSDQVMHWQTSVPHDRVATGWGGKMADLLNSMPNGPMTNPNISMNISLSGSNVYQTGQSSVEYAIHPVWGALGMNGYGDEWFSSQLRTEAVDNMVDAMYQDIFKKTYIKTVKTARDGNIQFQEAMDNATPVQTEFEATYLSDAFKMIANTINIREELGVKRQIFFVEYGGWDNHDELLQAQEELFTEVDDALNSFNLAMEELGLADKVTTFSISEFSRTLASNGNGTDHAWGANMFVMGGAVNGQQIYGQYPQIVLNSNLIIDNSNLIPTTSADEYFAELAMWFDVPTGDLLDIFPNLGNFYSVSSGVNPIGFMNI